MLGIIVKLDVFVMLFKLRELQHFSLNDWAHSAGIAS